MKYALYDILLHIIAVILSPYFILKMLFSGKYRAGLPERLGFIGGEKLRGLKGGGPVVWIHAVSVGETKAVMPILRLLKKRRPDLKILFSTVTRTGNETASRDSSGLIDALIYFPLDLSWAVRRAVSAVEPKAFIVVEKEFWPGVFKRLHSRNVPIIIVNGTVSDRSFRRFTRFSFIFRGMFSQVSAFLARTPEDAERAVSIGVPKGGVRAAGNVKFDLSPPPADASAMAGLSQALAVGPGDPVIVAGSTHPGEEEMILDAFNELRREFKSLKLIIAPRHPERFNEVEALIRKKGLTASRRSAGGKGDVVLLDTVGELMRVYSFSTVAFVGGSLVDGIGGHNLLEPAYYSKPVLYGAHLTAYLGMAELLEEAGGGIRVAGKDDLAKALKRLLSDPRAAEAAGRSAKKVVEANRGAAERTVDAIERLLPKKGRG